MERLEPVLKQKFWILLGMGILMTVIGWWMDTGTMAATIAARKTEIEAAEKKIPAGEVPNSEWSSGLQAINTQQDLAVKSASRVLWERQRARMTWPETVAEFAAKTGYREAIDVAGRENYRTDYENDWRRVWETLRPFNRIDGSGIVDFNLSKLPRHMWGDVAPSSEHMWDAQEDLWLLEGLLQLIAEVNGGANNTRVDAHIHVIEKLTLHGGQPAGQRTLPSTGGGGGMSSSSGAMDTSSFGGGSFGGSGGGGGAATTASADFDVKEELGDDGSGGGGQGAGMSSFGSAAALGSGGPGGSAASKVRRYIDDDKALPFRTRGFYMTLIMDHRKIPNLISELSASEKSAWPIEIIRVQVVRLNDDDPEGRGGGGSFNPGSGGGADSFAGSSGGSSSGFGSESSSGSSGSSGFSIEGGAGGGGAATAQGQAGLAALMNAVQDPNMSRVAICGIITLYNEVKPEPIVVQPNTPPVTPVTPTTETAAPPTTESAPTTEPAAAEGDPKPEAPPDGEPKTPAAATEETKPSSETKPADDAKPNSETAPPPAAAAKPTGAS